VSCSISGNSGVDTIKLSIMDDFRESGELLIRFKKSSNDCEMRIFDQNINRKIKYLFLFIKYIEMK
jgi:hypothetical protein